MFNGDTSKQCRRSFAEQLIIQGASNVVKALADGFQVVDGLISETKALFMQISFINRRLWGLLESETAVDMPNFSIGPKRHEQPHSQTRSPTLLKVLSYCIYYHSAVCWLPKTCHCSLCVSKDVTSSQMKEEKKQKYDKGHFFFCFVFSLKPTLHATVQGVFGLEQNFKSLIL